MDEINNENTNISDKSSKITIDNQEFNVSNKEREAVLAILNHNEVQTEFLKNKCFVIKDYQSGYRWGKDQIEKLIKDLISFKNETDKNNKLRYCLQPIVFKKLGKDEYEVLDGQQRLTTIYLILKKLNLSSEINFDIKYGLEGKKDIKDLIIEDSLENQDLTKNQDLTTKYINNALKIIDDNLVESDKKRRKENKIIEKNNKNIRLY